MFNLSQEGLAGEIEAGDDGFLSTKARIANKTDHHECKDLCVLGTSPMALKSDKLMGCRTHR